ncbi:hypothetical protein QAD02_003181 [Eretmocerus hayati]|uniref:Uncharacterized protein n=1 Tax=Eretmocerus hayati TaxID=131215 RepID=A0ACC2NNW1_9HYME|nr:hypothetical protein QAD02_003181 [Eretmocerus hayati]
MSTVGVISAHSNCTGAPIAKYVKWVSHTRARLSSHEETTAAVFSNGKREPRRRRRPRELCRRCANPEWCELDACCRECLLLGVCGEDSPGARDRDARAYPSTPGDIDAKAMPTRIHSRNISSQHPASNPSESSTAKIRPFQGDHTLRKLF